jgi:hypothetical protein
MKMPETIEKRTDLVVVQTTAGDYFLNTSKEIEENEEKSKIIPSNSPLIIDIEDKNEDNDKVEDVNPSSSSKTHQPLPLSSSSQINLSSTSILDSSSQDVVDSPVVKVLMENMLKSITFDYSKPVINRNHERTVLRDLVVGFDVLKICRSPSNTSTTTQDSNTSAVQSLITSASANSLSTQQTSPLVRSNLNGGLDTLSSTIFNNNDRNLNSPQQSFVPHRAPHSIQLPPSAFQSSITSDAHLSEKTRSYTVATMNGHSLSSTTPNITFSAAALMAAGLGSAKDKTPPVTPPPPLANHGSSVPKNDSAGVLLNGVMSNNVGGGSVEVGEIEDGTKTPGKKNEGVVKNSGEIFKGINVGLEKVVSQHQSCNKSECEKMMNRTLGRSMKPPLPPPPRIIDESDLDDYEFIDKSSALSQTPSGASLEKISNEKNKIGCDSGNGGGGCNNNSRVVSTINGRITLPIYPKELLDEYKKYIPKQGSIPDDESASCSSVSSMDENEEILVISRISKQNGLLSKERVFVLTNRPQIYYIDPHAKNLKGRIQIGKDCVAEVCMCVYMYIYFFLFFYFGNE